MTGTLENLLVGFQVVLDPAVLIYAFLGCLIGTVVGVLPGLGPLAGISILLPISFGLPPTTAIVLLAGIYYGAMYGGSTTSILMRIPGEAASVVTCIDGYEMARQGRAGPALAIAAIGSFVAGTVSVVALMLLAPPLARFALAFGPPEYFALLLMGLLVLATMSSGPMGKTLTMAVLGLLLGMIGIDPMSGYNRFSGGVHELSDGLGVLPLAVGLFGVSEIMLAYGTRAMQPMKPRFAELVPSRAEIRASVGPIGRGTVIGFLIGIIPGSAHILSSFVSYAVEKKLSNHPEKFGKGAVEGLAGPESANNAAASGAFVPMLALGVPLGPVQAILIAVLIVHGIAPGPLLIAQQPQLFWGFIASMYIGNLVLLDPQPAAGRAVRLVAADPLHLSLSCHPHLLHRRRVHGEFQHGRRADHDGGGCCRLRLAPTTLRGGTDRARLHPGADAGNGVPAIAGDVGRRLYNLPAAADHGRPAGDRRATADLRPSARGLARACPPEGSYRIVRRLRTAKNSGRRCPCEPSSWVCSS